MKTGSSHGRRGLEILIAGCIFTAVVFLGLHAMQFRLVPAGTSPGARQNPTAPLPGTISETPEPSDPSLTIGIPSSSELIRQVAQIRQTPKLPVRPLESWEMEVEQIRQSSRSPSERARQLMTLASTLQPPEASRVYVAACAVAPASFFQQQMYPWVWTTNLPPPVVRVLATAVITQSDAFKFPALLALQQSHPDAEIQAWAESVLAGYFPEETPAQYPLAVQRLLSGSYSSATKPVSAD